MTKNQKVNLKSLAKGSWQKGIAEQLERYGKIQNPIRDLKGNAKRYSLHYEESFKNLLNRIEKAGYKVNVQLGSRGGMWTAVYYIA